MEWYERIAELRAEKNTIEPGRFTVRACAKRAEMQEQNWSRMESGNPKNPDGTTRTPSLKLLRRIAVGLEEPVAHIVKIAGLITEPEETPGLSLARRLDPLLRRAPAEKRSQIEEAIEQMARIMVSTAS